MDSEKTWVGTSIVLVVLAVIAGLALGEMSSQARDARYWEDMAGYYRRDGARCTATLRETEQRLAREFRWTEALRLHDEWQEVNRQAP